MKTTLCLRWLAAQTGTTRADSQEAGSEGGTGIRMGRRTESEPRQSLNPYIRRQQHHLRAMALQSFLGADNLNLPVTRHGKGSS